MTELEKLNGGRKESILHNRYKDEITRNQIKQKCARALLRIPKKM